MAGRPRIGLQCAFVSGVPPGDDAAAAAALAPLAQVLRAQPSAQ
jgi:hypothetical protein